MSSRLRYLYRREAIEKIVRHKTPINKLTVKYANWQFNFGGLRNAKLLKK